MGVAARTTWWKGIVTSSSDKLLSAILIVYKKTEREECQVVSVGQLGGHIRAETQKSKSTDGPAEGMECGQGICIWEMDEDSLVIQSEA